MHYHIYGIQELQCKGLKSKKRNCLKKGRRVNQLGRRIEQQRLRQRHTERDRKRRLLALNRPERGDTICTKDPGINEDVGYGYRTYQPLEK